MEEEQFIEEYLKLTENIPLSICIKIELSALQIVRLLQQIAREDEELAMLSDFMAFICKEITERLVQMEKEEKE